MLWLPELKIAGVLTSVLFIEFVLLWPGLLEASLLSCGMDVARVSGRRYVAIVLNLLELKHYKTSVDQALNPFPLCFVCLCC